MDADKRRWKQVRLGCALNGSAAFTPLQLFYVADTGISKVRIHSVDEAGSSPRSNAN
jgi:hypothetical protein